MFADCQTTVKKEECGCFQKKSLFGVGKRHLQSEASTIATTSLNAAEKANLASAGFHRALSSLHI